MIGPYIGSGLYVIRTFFCFFTAIELYHYAKELMLRIKDDANIFHHVRHDVHSFLGDDNYDKKNNDPDSIGLDLEHRLVKCG